jgi:hypothetical protein
MLWTKIIENIKHMFYPTTFFVTTVKFVIIQKNAVEQDGPQMTTQYGESALHAG